MIPLDHLIAATSAQVLVSTGVQTLAGFAHDSRHVADGDCFVAVRGLHGDGHEYAPDAVERGARALLLEEVRIEFVEARAPGLLEHARRMGVAVLVVRDTREALRRYAAHILAEWAPTVVAVTGATGKTTTKEAIADVLALRGPTFRSWRNYNDVLGIPLSLGRLEPDHKYAVLELGADRPGEIADLCAMIRPRIGVVTNVSPAHLLYFEGVEAYADELARLPAFLPSEGVAVLNGDVPDTRRMGEGIAARAAYFGLADHSAMDGERRVRCAFARMAEPKGGLKLACAGGDGETDYTFPYLHGDHWAHAVLAAATVGAEAGVAPEDALRALQSLHTLPGRMRRLDGADGIELVDDSHNATPASAAAGLAALDGMACPRGAARIAVLGDMLRLGASAEEEHRRLGELAFRHADYLVTRGLLADIAADEARRLGMPAERIAVTHTAEDAAASVRRFVGEARGEQGSGAGAVVYVKGSEEARMEQVTALLLARPGEAETELDRQTQAWRRFVVMRPERPTWLEIDLTAIGNNTRLVKDLVGPEVRVLVSLKADAYGHGAVRVARTALLNGASWLGVATVSEAEPLRDAGIDAPILVFGYTAPWQAREAVRLGLRTTVYSPETARALSRAATELGREVCVHVKVDTGMARLGLRAEDPVRIADFVEELRGLPGLVVEGVFTHFATADSVDQTYARRQLRRFAEVLTGLDRREARPPIVHASNSAALLSLPEARFDMVRPGVAIYGIHPSGEVRLPAGFRPALAFKTQVAQAKWIPAGEGISYGATYVTREPTRIAVLPVGYADGFRRGPANWGEVLVRGRRAPLVGRVCMDQCMIDVTHIPDVRAGDEVVLIGRQGDDVLSAEAVAERLGTIAYEVVSELLARVPRLS